MSLSDRSTWTEPAEVDAAAREVERYAESVEGPGDAADALLDQLSDARFVLLGEASHGTSEFYRWRAHLTAELLRDHDFDFVAVEGDWTSCYEVNRYVKGLPNSAGSVRAVLDSFERWPTWMWANWEAAAFFEWIERHNRESRHGTAGGESGDAAGFYGLDVYSLFESMEAVVEYLERTDPDAAEHAREAYRCFEPYGEDAREYARSLRMVPEDCRDDVVDVLLELRESAPGRVDRDGDHADDAFAAEQNALVARNAEAYYRALASGTTDSWNVRDEHMAETLDRLLEHHGDDAKAVVWAHNTHVGDARATDMEERGRLNLGQLVREDNPAEEVELVGFSTHAGRVVAADAWGDPMAGKRVPAAVEGSLEDVFHRAGGHDRVLLTDEVDGRDELANPRGHRAIGVVYHPEREAGNYVPTDLRNRYDALVHLDGTTALHPVESHPDRERVPDLYPTGL